MLLFSFASYSPSTFGKSGYFPPFRDCHGAVARLAQDHPELDVVIRPKPSMFKNPRWTAELAKAFEYWGVNPSRLPSNLSLDLKSDTHDLILQAGVVVALNSTTLLEAGEEWARADGACGVRLVTGQNRVDARKFYAANGYEVRKEQTNLIKWWS